MAQKTKSKRKIYTTEFLIRSDNPNLIKDIKGLADKKDWSINQFIVNTLEKITEKSKKDLAISK